MTSLRFLTGSAFRVLRQTLKTGAARRRRSASWRSETLETRWLLATRTWTGGAVLNDKWSDPQNWKDEQVPQSGDSIVFPSALDIDVNGTDRTVNNDLPAGRVFSGISFLDGGYVISGNAIQLTFGILSDTGDSGSEATSNVNVIEVDIAIAASSSELKISVDSTDALHLRGKISGPAGAGVTLEGGQFGLGGGTIFMTGSRSNTYSGVTIVDGVNLGIARSAGTTTIPANLIVRERLSTSGITPGNVFLHNSNQISDTSLVTIENGSSFRYVSSSLTETIGSLAFQGDDTSVQGGGTLRLNGDVTFPAIPFEPTPPSSLIATIEMATFARNGKANWRFDIGANRALFIDGAMAGDVAVFKLGAGSLHTRGSQPNSYTGSTNVLAGTLVVSKAGGVQGNLNIGNAGAAPGGPSVARANTGTNAIANNAIVTVHGDGTFDGGDDVISQLIVNGGLILASSQLKPFKVQVAGTPLGTVMGGLSLPAPIGGVGANYDVADGPAAIDLAMTLLPGVGGNGIWTKRGAGTMRVIAGVLADIQTVTVEQGVLILDNHTRGNTQVLVRGGTLDGGGMIIGGLDALFGTVESDTLTVAGNASFGFDSRLILRFNASQVAVKRLTVSGTVTLGSLSAQAFPTLDIRPDGAIPLGTKVRIIDVAASQTVQGLFRAPDGTVLTEGATFTVDGQSFSITYQGGADGKDVELTRNSGPAFVNRSFPQTALEGEIVTLRGTITEPDTGDTFFLDIDWGDGQTETIEVPPGSSPDLAIDHRYLDQGRFNVKLLWRDQHGGSNDAEYAIRVQNVPPRLQNLNVTSPVAPGQLLTLTGSVADWIEGDDISIEINWGDGSRTTVIPNADGTFSIPYQYRRRGKYQITLTVKDEQDRSEKVRLRVDVV